MADHRSKVVALPGRTGVARREPVHPGIQRLAVKQLNELIMDLEQFSPQLSWSPQQVGIASTSSRIRLSIVRETLHQLVGTSPAGEPGAIRWAVELDGTRLEVERWSDEVTARFGALQCPDIPFTERKRELGEFMASRRELMRVLSSARDLIGQRMAGPPAWR